MSPIQTRASVLAVMEEVTEGTPVLASSANDFVALQDGFTFSPETELQENAEIRNSIGTAKPIIGIERGNASLPTYIRHSGVEGEAPDYHKHLKATFGTEEVESTEYDTVTGSTVYRLAVDTGEGVNFRRGQGVLVKDSPRSIRCIKEVDGDELVLNFKLSSAPGAGILLGKNVGYIPANSGHKSNTLELFRGNGGIREVIAGARVTEFSMEVTAGELINGNFTYQGVKYYFDPIKITATNKYFDFYDGAAVRTVTLTEKLYRDPHELIKAVVDGMNDTASADTFEARWYDYGANKGKFEIETDGATLELRFATGPNAANTIATALGFTATDKTGATSYLSNNEQSWATALTPDYDESDPLAAKAAEVFLGDVDDNFNVCVRTMTVTIANERSEIPCVGAETGVDSSEINNRLVTIELVATAEEHEARFFKYYRKGDNVPFQFCYGEKLGGNYQAGKSVVLYIPTATITSFETADGDGTVVFNITLQAYVDNQGNGEVYLNLL